MKKVVKRSMVLLFALIIFCMPIFAEEVNDNETTVDIIKESESVDTNTSESEDESKAENKNETKVELESQSEMESEFEVENEIESEVETECEEESDIKLDIEEKKVIEKENATLSEAEEIVDEEIIVAATSSVAEEVFDEKCEITVYYLTDMKLKNKGNGGSYNYSWDTFIVDKNEEFNIDEKIPEIIKHSSCDQEYTLVGFTTENQIDTNWKGADYAGGISTIDKNFIVDNDIEIFAVYEAKDKYISSLIIDNEITYKTTTIPNKAIKNIISSDNNDEIYTKDENVQYYKIKNNLDDTNYMFTKDSSEGKPIKIEDFSLEKYKNSK